MKILGELAPTRGRGAEIRSLCANHVYPYLYCSVPTASNEDMLSQS